MAPQKKSKKDANSINSKLALVMKSGKGTLLVQSQTLLAVANSFFFSHSWL